MEKSELFALLATRAEAKMNKVGAIDRMIIHRAKKSGIVKKTHMDRLLEKIGKD